MSIRRVRNIIFLRDVSILSVTAFGGPQGHFGMFLDMLVNKRAYLSEEDLIFPIQIEFNKIYTRVSSRSQLSKTTSLSNFSQNVKHEVFCS